MGIIEKALAGIDNVRRVAGRNASDLVDDPVGYAQRTVDVLRNTNAGLSPEINADTAGLRPMSLQERAAAAGGNALDTFSGGLGTFSGRLARTADLTAQKTAVRLLREGVPADRVWRETGWASRPDGWRFEIPDNASRFVAPHDQPAVLPLGEALAHDPLYAAYPQLRTASVEVTPSAKAHGALAPEDLSMSAYGPTPDALRRVLAHEGQHGVQEIEGFQKGGSPEMAFRDPRVWGSKGAAGSDIARSMYDERVKALRTPLSLDEYARQAGWGNDLAGAEKNWRTDYLPIFNKELHSSTLKDVQKQVAGEWYRRLAGEAEARLVEKRVNLTPEARRELYPWDDEYFRWATGVSPKLMIHR